ncbi:hypothetical protein GLOTRDRAFT_128751 [Gloeophyllum trabeum ATCC 11539]|uniref:Uncharacterized protein n=1 Tax=Gloeophyllum trabeum (strain ATCC 11539 / FP-39264 / Madison 617) TaxID=670483 RepID=S7RM90_GLOTA|nr:uncharacterized protein GLOTRDRAFT_128751 [Gloeophyllum trabeum ATCC 11539]EPQ55520.1 hypothetical protein GLOTRDRAFT_128751 [Gloeophyllum trabeum ATCC 11539]
MSTAYLNSLLFVLNRRKDARGTSGSHSEKHSLSRPRTRLPVHGRSAQGNIAIRIDTVQEFAGDTGSPVDDPFKSTLEMHDSHESE